MDLHDIQNMLLSGVIQQKQGFDEAISALELMSRQDPRYRDVKQCYLNIQDELTKAIKILKSME